MLLEIEEEPVPLPLVPVFIPPELILLVTVDGKVFVESVIDPKRPGVLEFGRGGRPPGSTKFPEDDTGVGFEDDTPAAMLVENMPSQDKERLWCRCWPCCCSCC